MLKQILIYPSVKLLDGACMRYVRCQRWKDYIDTHRCWGLEVRAHLCTIAEWEIWIRAAMSWIPVLEVRWLRKGDWQLLRLMVNINTITLFYFPTYLWLRQVYRDLYFRIELNLSRSNYSRATSRHHWVWDSGEETNRLARRCGID